ncbi:hypothetical protein FRB99_006818 [Tulasnella sp. 403]|nr:hypothetical protein FRB99_006818 [Tulasnella sp. 403]
MDELWGNAWSDPPAQNTAAEKPKPTWSGSNGPDEADIGLGSSSLAFGQPSWLTPRSPETDSNWASPSPGTTAEPPAWGKSAWTTVEDPLPQTSAEPIPQNEDEKEPQVDAWQEEEKNELDAPRESPPTVESTFPTSVAPDEVASDHRPPPISIKAPDSPEPTIPHQSPPFSSSLRRSVPPSPDTFGTFESGLMETSAVTAAWSPIGPSFGSATLAPEDAGWGSSAWDPTPTATARTDLEVQEHRDEWAAAQEEQVRREERVPQQLIDGLLAEWAELSVVLFPSENAPKDREELDLDFGLDQVEGLASDLSFLEDVPSVTEDADPDDQLKALEDLLSSKPATIVPKLPKPLAPPPRVPSGKNSTSPSPVTPTFASAGSSKVDDMWSIFEKPAAPIPKPILGPARMASASSRASTPILPPPLAPPPKASAPSSRAATPSGSKTNSPSVGQRPMSFTAIHIRAPSTASVDPPSLDTSPQPPKPPPKHFKVDSLDDFGDFSAFLPAIASSPSSTLSPGTPHTRPSLSPIITGPTPTSTRNPLSFATFSTPVQNGLDDGFGDFMSSGTLDVNQGRPQLMSTWPNATLSPNPNQNSLPSPRITAPDTPLHATDPNKPPPPRRSLSPLMNKIAKTQSDKWPRPMSPGMLPPILAPPPGPSTTRNAVAPPAQTMSPVDLFDAPPSFLPPDHQVEPPPQANTPSMNPIPHGIPGLGFKVIQPQNTESDSESILAQKTEVPP